MATSDVSAVPVRAGDSCPTQAADKPVIGNRLPATSASSSLPSSSQPPNKWSQGPGIAASAVRQRSFDEILADEKSSRNILEIHLMKNKSDADKVRNLTFDDMAEFLFDCLGVQAKDCVRFNYVTARYDTKEVMLLQVYLIISLIT